ncbi:MAG: hypothetical protein AAB495_03235 [Patescibacteria group bacterium]
MAKAPRDILAEFRAASSEKMLRMSWEDFFAIPLLANAAEAKQDHLERIDYAIRLRMLKLLSGGAPPLFELKESYRAVATLAASVASAPAKSALVKREDLRMAGRWWAFASLLDLHILNLDSRKAFEDQGISRGVEEAIATPEDDDSAARGPEL